MSSCCGSCKYRCIIAGIVLKFKTFGLYCYDSVGKRNKLLDKYLEVIRKFEITYFIQLSGQMYWCLSFFVQDSSRHMPVKRKSN